MTIVLFYGKLNTVDVFSKELGEGFKDIGYSLFWFDLNHAIEEVGRLYEYMKSDTIKAIIGFNSSFFSMRTSTGAYVWDTLKIPCINIILDHPYWYMDLLEKEAPGCINLFIDRGHMAFADRFYPKFAVSGFLPHGADMPESLEDSCVEFERTIDVFYAGSLYKDDIVKPDFSRWDFPAEEICEETISYLKLHTRETIEAVLEKQLLERGINLSENELCRFISSCVYIERIVSSYFRERIIRIIAESGISFTICGRGYDQLDFIKLPNVNYLGMITPTEVTEKMKEAKILLNTFPWFKDGCHERVFNGMLRGCVLLTEETPFMKEIFPESSYISYELTEEGMQSVPFKMRDILENDEKRKFLSEQGKNLIQDKHTWRARAKELHEDLLKNL